ncbi:MULTISPECIES: hypothetical protein [unclassified Saccharicrinis]|uniref:hypothetical protein n=1 Tax=unclassified Saccharicrinis TaxID=2646859 RepID=UPI003D34BD32
MKNTALLLFLVLLSMDIIAQEEFFRDKGGLSLIYGLSNAEGSDSHNSVGASIAFRSGLIVGLSSQQIADETKPQFHFGFQRKPMRKDSYTRPGFIFSYVKGSGIRAIGSTLGLSFLINAQEQSPTSITGILGITSITIKEEHHGFPRNLSTHSETIPIIGIGLNQALGAQEAISPIIGVGIARDLNYGITSFSFSLGLNFSFNGKTSDPPPL